MTSALSVEDKPQDDIANELVDVEIAAVSHFTSGKVCLACKGKVEALSDKIGRCKRCSTTQKVEKCATQMMATVLVDCTDHNRTFNVYLPMIIAITGDDTLMEDSNQDEITEALL